MGLQATIPTLQCRPLKQWRRADRYLPVLTQDGRPSRQHHDHGENEPQRSPAMRPATSTEAGINNGTTTATGNLDLPRRG